MSYIAKFSPIVCNRFGASLRWSVSTDDDCTFHWTQVSTQRLNLEGLQIWGKMTLKHGRMKVRPTPVLTKYKALILSKPWISYFGLECRQQKHWTSAIRTKKFLNSQRKMYTLGSILFDFEEKLYTSVLNNKHTGHLRKDQLSLGISFTHFSFL